MTIDWLIERMSEFRGRIAVIRGDEAVTFDHMLNEFRLWQSRKLAEYSIRPGDVVALEGDYSPAICAAILACIANGNIIVPLTTAVGHKRDELVRIAEAGKTIRFDGERETMLEHRALLDRNETLDAFCAEKRPGLILFTSGSTGAPKAILHDFNKLLDKYKRPRDTLRTLTFLLFDHIGGINTMMHTLANGGTIVVPESRNPEAICELIQRHRVELLPASPSFLNLLMLSQAYLRYDISSLKIITYGTEVMPDRMLEQLIVTFPLVQFRQTYGLSELGILRAKSKASGSPWLAIGGEGIETKIVDDELHIRSESAMVGYLNAPNPFDIEGWMNTQDVVLQDGVYIRFLGRRSEIINVGGQKVYPMEVENVLLAMPELLDVTVKGEPNPLLGQMVTAVVYTSESLSAIELKARIRSYCSDKLESFQVPMKVYIQEQPLFTDRFKKIRK